MNALRTLLVAAAALPLAALLQPAVAELGEPDGTVTLATTAVSVGVGWEWGGGTLTLKDGTTHRFEISGLNVLDVGISQVDASGEVYNLDQLSDFPGTYTAVDASAALIKGAGVLEMTNGKGTRMVLRSNQTGVRLQLGGSGLTVTLTD